MASAEEGKAAPPTEEEVAVAAGDPQQAAEEGAAPTTPPGEDKEEEEDDGNVEEPAPADATSTSPTGDDEGKAPQPDEGAADAPAPPSTPPALPALSDEKGGDVQAMEEGAKATVTVANPTAAPPDTSAQPAAEEEVAVDQGGPEGWHKKYQGLLIMILIILLLLLGALLGMYFGQDSSNGETPNQAVDAPPPGPSPVVDPTSAPVAGGASASGAPTTEPVSAEATTPSISPPTNVEPVATEETDRPTPSSSSSSTSSSPRFDSIVQKLEYLSGEALTTPGSPQHRAAMWMAHDDPLALGLDDPRFEQRYILAVFYYATDGDNWTQKQGWLSSQSECLWYGIDGTSAGCGGEGGVGGCIAASGEVGEYDRVCRIGMGRLNNLYGQLPSELGQLSEMRWFEVQDDYLIGTIPDALGEGWSKLHTLLVGGNYLQGGFPSSFDGNEMLGTVFIDRNQFNGTFPSVLATLTNLEWLDAEGNEFVGELPAGMGELRSLRILNVNNNSMTGSLPDTWDDTSRIEDFEVAHNAFTGELPASLGTAKLLKDLRASGNQLTGPIPETYYGLANLEELYLDENDMAGELPQTAEPFYDGLQEFSIDSNNFSGRFPVERFEGTFRLKVLSLHNNQLTGSITANICARRDSSLAYSQLTTLSADCDMIECECCDCYENGEIISTYSPPVTTASPPPSNVTTASPTAGNLNWSDLENESVVRPTRAPNSPSSDRNASAVQELIESTVLQRGATFDDMDESDPRYMALDWLLYKDQIQLTTDDTNLAQRYVLALLAYSLDSLAWFVCGEQQSGEEDCLVREFASLQTQTHKVWLSSTEECDWYGVICTSSDGVVRGLELIANDLIGQIPPEISQLPLQYLALAGNCLYGTLPPEIGSMQDLLSLELHRNGLSQAVPQEMSALNGLQLLNIAEQFQHSAACQRSNGEIVNTLYEGGDPANGFNFGLEGNVLGPDVGLWKSLRGLHVFDNSFAGAIADEIGGLSDLRFLRAHNNLFELAIPSSIVGLSNLRELYLSKNQLWSDLPSGIGQMESLEDLRVNENEMYGTLPSSLYDLRNLSQLWLQDTLKCEEVDFKWECRVDLDSGFKGSIQTEIGNLSKLSYLLLQTNPLTGTLPTELGLCEQLSVLHIHKTNIEGTVPEEVCMLRDKELHSETGQGIFYADCLPTNKTGDPFIECDCCTDCCDHATQVCIADD